MVDAKAHSAAEEVHARQLPRAIRRFVHTESAGGIVLVVAAIVALIWANSGFSDSYHDLWNNTVTLKLGDLGVSESFGHFVNDGLMALFFVVVGLEIKRELVTGELRDPRVAALPALAAAGGMIVPAAVYAVFNAGHPGSNGWGIPMATDIAFALGVVALLGSRVPAGLKLFLLTLSIVDDIGAIGVIAVFYSDSLDAKALAIAVGSILAAALLRRSRVWWTPIYIALGVLCWFATYSSGVHATLAGVAFGLLAPARPIAPVQVARGWAEDLSDEPGAGELRQMTTMATYTVSVAERFQHMLHPITSFVVVPIFALANAGVRLSGDAFDADGTTRVAAGVMFGLIGGKILGIVLATALALRLRLASLPEGTSMVHVAGVASVAGIGFTVSLFVTDLAFKGAGLEDAARIAVLIASILAAALGASLLCVAARRSVPTGSA